MISTLGEIYMNNRNIEWCNSNSDYPDSFRSTCKHNLVCVDCRSAARRYPKGGHPKCPHCQKPMFWLGTKGRIPKKTNDKLWNKWKNSV